MLGTIPISSQWLVVQQALRGRVRKPYNAVHQREPLATDVVLAQVGVGIHGSVRHSPRVVASTVIHDDT